MPPSVTHKDQIEIWWKEHIMTITKIKNSRPDIVIWHTKKQLCHIVEVTVPLDKNLKKADMEKKEK